MIVTSLLWVQSWPTIEEVEKKKKDKKKSKAAKTKKPRCFLS